MYKVLSEFIEGGHHYKKNDDYPFSDTVDQERAEYLVNAEANGRVAFIEKVVEELADEDELPEDVIDVDSMKVEELKLFLDKENVPYEPKAKRPELLTLAKKKVGLSE
ncbi:hypothetical protein [Enterococcus sp. AZ109]|uniref:hypothetical protein n=1 Tax=Enterococcus sp. AZ109 TaxID=2774634 RepID=UPI003F2698D7